MADGRETSGGKARVLEPNRAQIRLMTFDLENALPSDHQARAIWQFVGRLDLNEFYQAVQSREGKAGRPAIDPKILLCLWIMATVDAVGSARELERLCQQHLAYQWICGGVNVNYHTLSDFRSSSADRLNGLLTQIVAMLMSADLVRIERVSHDGMVVRASAGASSFRRRETLNELRQVAKEQVERLADEIDTDPAASKTRQEQARKRAAEERAERIEKALEMMPEAERRKKSNNGKRKTVPRTSTTDPESFNMRMADGGYRPALNVHLATDVGSGVVVGVKVDNEGTDKHSMVPLADQIESRFAARPQEWLTDGGCSSNENINELTQRGCKVYSPLRERRSGRQPWEIRPTDSEAVKAWRERMITEEAKEIYKLRGATSEWVNAQCRAQGLHQFLVRGVKKALSVVLLHTLTHNMRRAFAFGA